MAARTTTGDVQAILGSHYDSTISLQPFIDTAVILVDWLDTQDTDNELSVAALEMIERYIAAHIYEHADQIAQGSNQVVCNWVDKVAINISNNPSSTRLNNCPGDLWVSDPANNAGGNKYEDETGAWHTVPGTAARESGACVGRDGMFSEIAGAPSGHAAAVRVRIPHQGPWELAIAAANGRTVRSLTGTTGGDIELAASGLGAGVRVVTFAQDGMRFVKRLVVR